MTVSPRQSLLRPEALSGRQESLYGNISLAVPIAWHAIGLLIFVAVAGFAMFAAVASYSRSEVVDGIVSPTGGVIVVLPSKPGVVTRLLVEEGARVKRGDILAEISGEEVSAAGVPLQSTTVGSLDAQRRNLSDQAAATRLAGTQDAAELAAQIASASAEIGQLKLQIEAQEQLVASAVRDLDQIKGVVSRGFVSIRDLRAREETLLVRRQRLAELRQTFSAKSGELAETRNRLMATRSRSDAALAAIAASSAQLGNATASAETSRAFLVRSPIDGYATAITAHVGDTVSGQAGMMMVVPQGARLRAELYLPSRAAGFVSPGQEVRLMVDAFSYDKFGTVPATVTSVSRAPINRAGLSGQAATPPVYLVVASIPDPSIRAFGARRPLTPGMTLSARVITQRQSLLQLLFQPFTATQGR